MKTIAASFSPNTGPPLPPNRNSSRSSSTPPGASTASLLEAEVLARAAAPVPLDQEITFDIVDAHRLLNNLGIQSQRLSRQFQKTLATLRDLQADRAHRERRDLADAAALLELHKHKGIPWQPADHGFVFSLDQVEHFAERAIRLNESRHIEHVRFHMPPAPQSKTIA